jgi:malate synthase
MSDVKLPWYIDLLNVNLNNHDREEAARRIRLLENEFRTHGKRLTENIDFQSG